MPLNIIRGRAAAGIPAALGALLLIPSIGWPTWGLSMPIDGSNPDEDSSDGVFIQRYYSWGRWEVESTGEAIPPDFALPIPVLALWARIVLVLFGLAAAAIWLWGRGQRGRLLGVAGTSVAWTIAVVAIVGRVTTSEQFLFGGSPSPTFEIYGAGTAENAALVLLTVALLIMLARPLAAAARDVWREGRAWSARMREQTELEDEAPRRTVALVREVDADEYGRGKDGTYEGTHDRQGAVGFSDLVDDDARFRPRDADQA